MKKIYVAFVLLFIQSVCAFAQNEDDRFANWSDEQYSTYEDSIYKALYAPIITFKEDASTLTTSKLSRIKRSLMTATVVGLPNVPNAKVIDTSKGVGEIPITSGISQTGGTNI